MDKHIISYAFYKKRCSKCEYKVNIYPVGDNSYGIYDGYPDSYRDRKKDEKICQENKHGNYSYGAEAI